MRKVLVLAVLIVCGGLAEETQVTVYNQDFGVVKQGVSMDLKQGDNEIRVTDLTKHLEEDSVILKDKNNLNAFKILEQNYESDPLSEGLLLMKNEGNVLDFETMEYDEVTKTSKKVIKKAKIIRSGYVPHTGAFQRYGQRYTMAQQSYGGYYDGGTNQPIVDMDGKLMFRLPGTPVFASLGNEVFVKPTIMWKIRAEEQGKRDAEFSYITGGMSWDATYNCIAPEKGDTVDIIGWVNVDNQSGKDFKNSSIKLMAGDVAKLQNNQYGGGYAVSAVQYDNNGQPIVKEKAFDDYHLYTLPRKVDLLDRETKQVEFVRASNVKGSRYYVYDGLKQDNNSRYTDDYSKKTRPDFGTMSNTKVWNMFEFKNEKGNNLGIALPKGVVKLYRKDSDNHNEFLGEDSIDHTPSEEIVRLYMGNAFDIAGERKQSDYKLTNNQNSCEEEFKITLNNHKKEKVVVLVKEHLYRWVNWEIMEGSDIFMKKDSKTIEFRAEIEPGKDKVLTYRVKYNWN